jgi:hypothetical protein
MPDEDGLDLGRLDPEPPDLDLRIRPPPQHDPRPTNPPPQARPLGLACRLPRHRRPGRLGHPGRRRGPGRVGRFGDS